MSTLFLIIIFIFYLFILTDFDSALIGFPSKAKQLLQQPKNNYKDFPPSGSQKFVDEPPIKRYNKGTVCAEKGVAQINGRRIQSQYHHCH